MILSLCKLTEAGDGPQDNKKPFTFAKDDLYWPYHYLPNCTTMKRFLIAVAASLLTPALLSAQSLDKLPSLVTDSLPTSLEQRLVSPPVDTLKVRVDSLSSNLEAAQGKFEKAATQTKSLADTATQAAHSTFDQLASLPDSLVSRLDSLPRLIPRSPLTDPVYEKAQGGVEELKQGWEGTIDKKSTQLLDEHIPVWPPLDVVNKYQRVYSSDHIEEEVVNSLEDVATDNELLPQEVGSLSGQYSEVQSELEAIAKDSTQQSGVVIDQKVDQYAGQQKGLQPLTEASAQPSPVEQSLQGYQSQMDQATFDKTEVQQLLLSRLQALGSDYQQDFAKRIKKSTKKLARHRQDYQTSPKADTTANSGKKRLRLGGNFQLQPGHTTRLDISPELQYRLLPRWSIGVGGTYRIGIQTDDFPKQLVQQEGVYGGRGLTEWQAFPSISLRAEWESLYSGSNDQLGSLANDLPSQRWNDSVWLGLVKYYSVSSWVKGSIQLLYNPLHDPSTDLYTQPYTIRLGFQFQPSAK